MASIKRLGSNKLEMSLGNGVVVFYSYDTPVALRTVDGKYYRTATRHSVTTQKHINAWLSSRNVTMAGELLQEDINARAAIIAVNP